MTWFSLWTSLAKYILTFILLLLHRGCTGIGFVSHTKEVNITQYHNNYFQQTKKTLQSWCCCVCPYLFEILRFMRYWSYLFFYKLTYIVVGYPKVVIENTTWFLLWQLLSKVSHFKVAINLDDPTLIIFLSQGL